MPPAGDLLSRPYKTIQLRQSHVQICLNDYIRLAFGHSLGRSKQFLANSLGWCERSKISSRLLYSHFYQAIQSWTGLPLVLYILYALLFFCPFVSSHCSSIQLFNYGTMHTYKPSSFFTRSFISLAYSFVINLHASTEIKKKSNKMC